MKKIVGIDVSKDTFDVSYDLDTQKVHQVFSNNEKGFSDLLATTSTTFIYVMEATGPYYYALACYLYQAGCQVSVLNPLVAKRFCQTIIQRAKTDKADASSLRRYGETFELSFWQPAQKGHIEITQLYGNLRRLTKSETALSNQLYAYKTTGELTGPIERMMREELMQISQRIKLIEKLLISKIEELYPDLYEDLLSIPGIGPQSAMLLLVFCKGFKDFDNYKQVIAYLGLSPNVHRSGTSVKGKGHICKKGTVKVRVVLYMAAKSAIRWNKSCKQFYERLRAKGKPYRVAIIAVVNKLIKQAFAIVKSGLSYQVDFVSQFEKNKPIVNAQ